MRQLCELTGLARGEAEAALRRHLGVCYDVCHAAVEFEDPAGSLRALRGGRASACRSCSSAPRCGSPRSGPRPPAQLRPFDEPVYLHQVIERRGDRLTRHLDLPQALADARRERAAPSGGCISTCRSFSPSCKDFSTTQAFLREILALHRREPISPHLEVETYTWDVLPARYRQVDVASAIARELAWVIEQLDA